MMMMMMMTTTTTTTTTVIKLTYLELLAMKNSGSNKIWSSHHPFKVQHATPWTKLHFTVGL